MLRSRIVSVGTSLPGRRFFGNSALDHAIRAGRDALKKMTYFPSDIELLIYAGVHRDKHCAEPAFATFVQRGLNLNIDFQGRQTFSYDLIDGAAGMLNAMDTIDAHIQAGNIEVGMAIASEANTDRHPRPEYVTARSGAAVILDASPLSNVGFRSFRFQTFTEHTGLYESYVDISVKKGCLHVDKSPEFESVLLDSIEKVVREYLSDEGLSPSDIDLVCPPQISPSFVASLGARTGISQDKFIDLTGNFPDTHSTAPILAFSRAVSAGYPTHGSRCLFLGAAAGINIGAAIYEF